MTGGWETREGPERGRGGAAHGGLHHRRRWRSANSQHLQELDDVSVGDGEEVLVELVGGEAVG